MNEDHCFRFIENIYHARCTVIFVDSNCYQNPFYLSAFSTQLIIKAKRAKAALLKLNPFAPKYDI